MSTTIVTAGGRSRLVHPADVPLLGCIEADIPWSSDTGGGQIQRGADRHYKPLRPYEAVETIIRSPLWRPDREAGCHLWLWVTNLCLTRRYHVIVLDALGFHEVSVRTWHKERVRPGLGKYMRGETEHVILASCGPARVPPPMRDPPTTHLSAPLGRHSQKPAANVRDVERISPGPRAELFAREPREGWYSWGNDPALYAAVVASEVAELPGVSYAGVFRRGEDAPSAVRVVVPGGDPETGDKFAASETAAHLHGCEAAGLDDNDDVRWWCAPGCPATRDGIDVVSGAQGRVRALEGT